MVGLARLELATPPLSRVCSNQLSYKPAPINLSKDKPVEFRIRKEKIRRQQ